MFAAESTGGTDNPSPEPAKKLHVDEDWKSQVEAEKEAAAAAQRASTAAGASGSAATPVPSAAPAEPAKKQSTAQSVPPDYPPADLQTLLSMLAAQAMVTLGALPNPLTGKAETNLPEARHFIDLIDTLEQKTRGNVTPQEASMLESLLHELRMAYVASETAAKASPPK